MSKEEILTFKGQVVEVLPNKIARVKLFDNDSLVTCYTKDRLNGRKARLIPGDEVKVEMSIYDLNKGRIVDKKNNQSNHSTGSKKAAVKKKFNR